MAVLVVWYDMVVVGRAGWLDCWCGMTWWWPGMCVTVNNQSSLLLGLLIVLLLVLWQALHVQ